MDPTQRPTQTPTQTEVPQNVIPPGQNPREVAPPSATEPAKRGKRRRAAVFVAHGMGQQLPFETLDYTADLLIKASENFPGNPKSTTKIQAQTVLLGKTKMQRLEFELPDANGQPLEVHVYEGYWAPIPEGQVKLRDVLSFLYNAGIRDLFRPGNGFQRWLFGDYVNFQIPGNTRYYLLLTFLVLLTLILIGALLTVVAATHLLAPHIQGTWPSVALLRQITRIIGFFDAITVIFGLSILITYKMKAAIVARSKEMWKQLNEVMWGFFRGYVGFVIVIGAILFVVSAWDFIRQLAESKDELSLGWRFAVWIVWGVLYLIIWAIRSFLIQYLGDVAAYVSSHRLDRFMEIRSKIKQWVYERLAAIYQHTDKPDGKGKTQNPDQGETDKKPYYDQVGLIGHSLGSVIVYDTLNALINDDELDERRYKVAERTRTLLTFGSPLDKIAYVFGLAADKSTVTHAALAASVQPLILDYAKFRRMKWLNVYARHDIIGGDLDFFDNKSSPLYSDLKVINIEDKDALVPLMAHNEMWDTGNAFSAFYEAFR